mmetsp:Transcript_41188/g.108720  ORF Transcript_41188/g.108720 Transcript_41188/m.108720 type:complete len:247 (+) Transcript_41188:176-916(+)
MALLRLPIHHEAPEFVAELVCSPGSRASTELSPSEDIHHVLLDPASLGRGDDARSRRRGSDLDDTFVERGPCSREVRHPPRYGSNTQPLAKSVREVRAVEFEEVIRRPGPLRLHRAEQLLQLLPPHGGGAHVNRLPVLVRSAGGGGATEDPATGSLAIAPLRTVDFHGRVEGPGAKLVQDVIGPDDGLAAGDIVDMQGHWNGLSLLFIRVLGVLLAAERISHHGRCRDMPAGCTDEGAGGCRRSSS